MPARLLGEIRRKVANLWILGHEAHYIATNAGVSVGSVRNIISELRQGRIVDYEGFVEHLDELRWLSQQLTTSNLTLQEAAIGIIIFNALAQLGLNPQELKELIVFLRRVSPPDFPIQQFVRATLQIAKLESGTGMTFPQLEANAGSLRSEVAALEARKAELEKVVGHLKSTEQGARLQMEHGLAENKVTTQALQEYVTHREVLRKAGLNINDLKPLSDLIKKATAENFLKAVLELSRLESQTGKDSASVLEDYKQKMLRNTKLDEEYSRLRREIASYQSEIRQLGLARDRQIVDNLTTEDQLRRYVGIRSRLATKGVAIETLEVLESIVKEFEKYGWQPAKMIGYMQQIGDLEQRTRQAKLELVTVNKQLDAQRSAHQLSMDMIRTKTIDVERLKKAEERSRTELEQIQQRTKDMFLQVDFADTLLRLFNESASVKDEQLIRLVENLQLVLRTRITVRGLSVDYEPLRQRLLFLLEIVVGKKLVTREMMEEHLRALRNQVTDLQFDRLGKLQKEQDRLNRDREILLSAARKFEQEQLAFERASEDELLAISVARAENGSLYLLVCKRCGYREVCQLGTTRYRSKIRSCPCCYSTLVPRDLAFDMTRLSRSKQLPQTNSAR
jgi:hypothetical protein